VFGFILLAKALAWEGVRGHKWLTIFLRLFSAVGAVAVCVVLIMITELRKPDEEPWSNLQKWHWAHKAPDYPAPKNPGVHMASRAEAPSSEMCLGAKNENDRVKCLCPHPLAYTLKAFPAPSDDNYSTEVRIPARNVFSPMYHLRIFAKTPITPAAFSASPYGKVQGAVLMSGVLTYDHYSVILQSSRPEQEFKIELHSAEGLGITCIEQQN
jgi:hypothetical protein